MVDFTRTTRQNAELYLLDLFAPVPSSLVAREIVSDWLDVTVAALPSARAGFGPLDWNSLRWSWVDRALASNGAVLRELLADAGMLRGGAA
jgi:hypothetical protein